MYRPLADFLFKIFIKNKRNLSKIKEIYQKKTNDKLLNKIKYTLFFKS